MIVGVGADFLDVGTSPVYHAKGFSHGQSYRNGTKGKFVQFESILSLTGGKADSRYTIPTGSELSVLLLLVKALLKNTEVKGSKAVHNIAKKIVGQNELAIASVKETCLELTKLKLMKLYLLILLKNY